MNEADRIAAAVLAYTGSDPADEGSRLWAQRQVPALLVALAAQGLAIVEQRDYRHLGLRGAIDAAFDDVRAATVPSRDEPGGWAWLPFFRERDVTYLGSEWPVYLIEKWERNAVGEERFTGQSRTYTAPATPASDALDELRRLSEAATPGSWEAGRESEPGDYSFPVVYVPSTKPDRLRWMNPVYTDHPDEDAAFIVAAVNYVRSFLAGSSEPGR